MPWKVTGNGPPSGSSASASWTACRSQRSRTAYDRCGWWRPCVWVASDGTPCASSRDQRARTACSPRWSSSRQTDSAMSPECQPRLQAGQVLTHGAGAGGRPTAAQPVPPIGGRPAPRAACIRRGPWHQRVPLRRATLGNQRCGTYCAKQLGGSSELPAPARFRCSAQESTRHGPGAASGSLTPSTTDGSQRWGTGPTGWTVARGAAATAAGRSASAPAAGPGGRRRPRRGAAGHVRGACHRDPAQRHHSQPHAAVRRRTRTGDLRAARRRQPRLHDRAQAGCARARAGPTGEPPPRWR